ncbi:hypothetical protein CYMTET_54438 [Cymbomonas tetramitiformis]|uniref:Uncharacterized protein n=1 Tax=Cymbomonas tetramitiformis TaxID=36881 RepID=A0AAE0EPK5_9CHLO|nr:hypothetical protein CYMTET_54438 [Cymbomonas tetramitiformis]
MRRVIRRCGDCFANKLQDIVGYKGSCPHPTFSIPFENEDKAAYQRPRKYSPGEKEIVDMHCKELLEYGFTEPASEHCRHASNVVVAGKKDHERDGEVDIYARLRRHAQRKCAVEGGQHAAPEARGPVSRGREGKVQDYPGRNEGLPPDTVGNGGGPGQDSVRAG